MGQKKVAGSGHIGWEEELADVGAELQGNAVWLYHATTPEIAQKILEEKVLRRPSKTPDSYGVYGTTSKREALSDNRGGAVVRFLVPLRDIDFEDHFPGSALWAQIATRRGVYRPMKIDKKILHGKRQGATMMDRNMSERKSLALVMLKQGKVDDAIEMLSSGDSMMEEIGNALGPFFQRNKILYDILEARIQDRGKLLKAKREMERRMLRLLVDLIDRYSS